MTQTAPDSLQPSKPRRVGQVEVDGRPGWRKEVETLRLSLRLRKGDPRKGFEREKATYLSLQGKGLPVPELLDVGEDFFVTADAGINLNRIRKANLETPEVFHKALADGAAALARLHNGGFCHGRPALKDICWQDGTITFIDLDNARPGDMDGRGYARDLLIFLFTAISETGGVGPEISAAARAYQEADTQGVWALAVARAKRLNRWRWALWPVVKLLNGKREFRAILPFLDFMTK